MLASYIILIFIGLGSICGGLYLFGEAKSSLDRRNAIEKMYDREQDHPPRR